MAKKSDNIKYRNFNNQNNCSVSVIVSVYNGEKYLEACLKSLHLQTLNDIEFICVNDGSTDSSESIILKYIKKDPRFRLISKANENVGKARNMAISHAKGKYLIFLDADDFFEPTLAEDLFNHAERLQCEIVTYKVDYFDDINKIFYGGDDLIKRQYAPNKDVFAGRELGEHIFDYTMGQAWDKIFLKEFVEKNKLHFLEQNIFEDAYFTITAMAVAQRISHLNKLLLHQRKNVQYSLTNNKDKYIDLVFQAFDNIRKKLIENNLYSDNIVKKAFINRLWAACCYFYNTVSIKTKREFYLKLKHEYLEYFELSDKPEDYFFDKNYYEFLTNVKKYEYIEYIEASLEIAQKKADMFYKKFIQYKNNGNSGSGNDFRNEIELIKSSWTYRIGDFLLYIPKKIREIMRKHKSRVKINKKSNIAVCYITDKNFYRPTLVSIASLKANRSKNIRYKVYVFAENLSKYIRDQFTNLSVKNFDVIVWDVANVYANLDMCKNVSTSHVNKTALLKFDIANILKSEDKVLYLDGDIIVQSNLKKLYATDLTGCYLAAVKDIVSEFDWHKKKVLYKSKYYFNSGMMLMNLALMRRDNIGAKLIKYRVNQFNFYMDQDAFNVVCGERVKYLPVKYNFMNKLLREKSREWINSFYNIRLPKKESKIFSKCNIVHFASDKKPWKYDIGYCSDLYKKYYNMTFLKEFPLNLLPLPQFNFLKNVGDFNTYLSLTTEYQNDLVLCFAIKDEGSVKWKYIDWKKMSNQDLGIKKPSYRSGCVIVYDNHTDYLDQQLGKEVSVKYHINNAISITASSQGGKEGNNGYAKFIVSKNGKDTVYDIKNHNRGLNCLVYSRSYDLVVDHFYVDTYSDENLTIKRGN